MADKKRVGIVLNSSVYDKLQLVSDRYGMTVNSLMAYILGQWADANFDVKDKLINKMIQEMTRQMTDIESNPVLGNMVKEVLADVVKAVNEKEDV